MSKLTLQDVRDHLGIDFDDAMVERNLEALLSASESYLTGALGQGVPFEDERVKTVQKVIISDLYDNRDLSDKVQGATRRLVDSMLLQVRLEMRSDPHDEVIT